jgi:hypothetical protein
MLIAKPSRALMDLVCLRKTQWQGLEWLTEGMRIEEEDLETVTEEDIEILKLIYKQKRVQVFVKSLAGALELDND